MNRLDSALVQIVRPYAAATVAVAIATGVCWSIFRFVNPANLIMIYLLTVVGVATRCGRGPSALASILGVAAFDFFFVPPRFAFAVADTTYLPTFAVMLIVALVISGLTVRIRRQAEGARLRERRTAKLYAMSRELAESVSAADLMAIAARHIAEAFDVDIRVLLPALDGTLRADSADRGVDVDEDEMRLARWALEHRQAAGQGTATSGTARSLQLPLFGSQESFGVMVLRPRQRNVFRSPEPFQEVQAFINQAALGLERARLARDAQDARVRAETERLRNALLTSVSHDLRTPLATITGAATTILDSGAKLDATTQRELVESIRDEGERLNRLVHNLLQMTRLESGALQLRRDWHPLEELVGAALGRVAKGLVNRRVSTWLPAELPLVAIDDVLIEQVLVNLLDNAIKYTPPGSDVRIIATATDEKVTVEVADHGPGLPPGEEDKVFEKFHRAAPSPQGAGLGLAICRGIVEAHGGRIWAQNLPEGGVAFLFTLPLIGGRPATVPADA